MMWRGLCHGAAVVDRCHRLQIVTGGSCAGSDAVCGLYRIHRRDGGYPHAAGRWGLVFRLRRGQYLQSMLMGLINPRLYYFLLFGAFDRPYRPRGSAFTGTWALVLAYVRLRAFLGQKLRRIDILAGLVCYALAVVIATRGAVTSLSILDPLGAPAGVGQHAVWAFIDYCHPGYLDPVAGLFRIFYLDCRSLCWCAGRRRGWSCRSGVRWPLRFTSCF